MKTKTNQTKPLGRVMWAIPSAVGKFTALFASKEKWGQWEGPGNPDPYLIIPMTDRAAVVEVMTDASLENEDYSPTQQASAALAALGWPESGERKKRRTT